MDGFPLLELPTFLDVNNPGVPELVKPKFENMDKGNKTGYRQQAASVGKRNSMRMKRARNDDDAPAAQVAREEDMKNSAS